MTRKRSEYSELLKDPRWQKLRLQIFERDGWKCQCCGDEHSTLAVHHLYYQRNLSPWEYPLSALTTLCERCHDSDYHHRAEQEQRLLSLLRKHGFLAVHIFQLANSLETLPFNQPISQFLVNLYLVLGNRSACEDLVKIISPLAGWDKEPTENGDLNATP